MAAGRGGLRLAARGLWKCTTACRRTSTAGAQPLRAGALDRGYRLGACTGRAALRRHARRGALLPEPRSTHKRAATLQSSSAELLPPEAQRELLVPFARVSSPTMDAIEPDVCRAAALRLAALNRGADDDAPVARLAVLLGRDPADADALTELALHHLAREQLGAASSVCNRIPQGHAQGMHACGLVALRQGALHVAETRLRASLAANPASEAARPLGALLLSTRHYPEAVVVFDGLHRRHPADYGALVDFGIALVWAGCPYAGRAAYRRATKLAPERPEAWYDLGLLYRFLGNEDELVESLVAFQRFAEIAAGRPELAPLLRTLSDEDCLVRWRGAHPACDPGHLFHIARSGQRELRGHAEGDRRRPRRDQAARGAAGPERPQPSRAATTCPGRHRRSGRSACSPGARWLLIAPAADDRPHSAPIAATARSAGRPANTDCGYFAGMDLWRVKRVEARQAVLDFSSSDLGQARVTQVVADGVVIANAREHTRWTERASQVQVCEECGVERCTPGGWVAARRAGDVVLWIQRSTRWSRSTSAHTS